MKKIGESISIPVNKKFGSQRGEVLEYFRDRLLNKHGKRFDYAFLNMKTAHLSLEDLYYMQSVAKDIERRGGNVGSYFWFSLKV